MKKLLILIAVGLLVLAGCTPTEEPTPTVYKVGTASYTSVQSNAFNAETGADGRIRVNTYYATVALDADGKFVYVYIDTAQNQGTFDEEGNVVTAAAIPTKKERGDDYGMKARSEIGKEWYEQIAALEAWMIGKTPAEVKAVPTKVVDDAHQFVPDHEDLNTSVTITIEGYLKVVEKAVANAVEVEDVAKVGAGSYSKVAGRNFNPDTDVAGRIQVNVTFAGVALDADGKIVYSHIDTAQNQGTFDSEGAIDAAEAIPSKKERGDAYGMKARSEIGKEWYEQIAALEEHILGKTPAEVKNIPTKVVDDAHQHVPSGEDLTSSVTITIEAYQGAVEKAAANAIAIP
jgi:uncharacterized protein YdbL (DUF1318 family)